jgi:hypothetical protein
MGGPSLDEVKMAKASLGKKLGSPSWLKGIGIAFTEDGRYCIKVNVAELTPEVLSKVPSRTDGVLVCVDEVDQIALE